MITHRYVPNVFPRIQRMPPGSIIENFAHCLAWFWSSAFVINFLHDAKA